ncbi:hypothetical protein JOB18_021009 [Solea senegalensis]|uniref:Uncharacterized protein n=1 Tax=Solea senegalensis TaxID=28829 RepID=A0AAV6RBG0_SOLSE|nr:uncharacterized protein si:ch211-67e16.4 [Solea senegalensis]XP_043873596.1 uncharacterized protein si:ch211-67e16.4 [Solea senegalensis]KAG7502503.1 hypothetical protein JOB18_021009 [Solea senegalensis]
MDVSIAVSLIRGQMGTVVERAVNGAVETVLAEMLKVVGVKFEELKAQLALMKRDVTALHREKALKEKENDNIRAKLRYTELKLKYYRQGVAEELQQRAPASTLVRVHPPTFTQTQRGGEAGLSPSEASPSCSGQTKTTEGAMTRNNPECTSPQSTGHRTIRVRCHPDMGVSSDSSDLLLPASLPVNASAQSLDSSTVGFCPIEQDIEESGDSDVAPPPPPIQAMNLDHRKLSEDNLLSPEDYTQADSSTLPSSALQVKQEAQLQEEEEEEEEEEVICIKEEPEEEQEVMAAVLLDCQVQQVHVSESEAQSTASTEWSGLSASQRNHTTAFSSAGPSTYLMVQPATSLPLMGGLTSGVPPRQAMRPWTKDLSLYEEYKLRRNELRRRSLNKRRELEKTLPQPLLADLVRERREKTRLRVARWRAKRKLQACLNQAQAQGGAAGLSHAGFSIGSQHQELRASCASASSGQQRWSSTLAQSCSFLNNNNNNNNNNNMSAANSFSDALPFITSTSSSSLLLRGPCMSTHQHGVNSSSSSSTSSSSSSMSHLQVSQSQQSFSLTDSDLLH